VSAAFRADDRVLLLAIPSTTELVSIARILMRGVLVALGPRDEIDIARSAMSEFDNTMFIEAQPNEIPWRDAYFTKIIVPVHLEPLLRMASAELQRVLAPGGEVIRQAADG
jgi:hypothetical protein